MQPTTSFLGLLGLSTLSLSAVLPREPAKMYISDFSFSGTPHSLIAHYSFNVSSQYDNILESSVRCETTTSTSPEITTFGLTACAVPSYAFSWTNYDAGVNQTVVTITHMVDGHATNLTAERVFEYSDVKTQEGSTPTGDVRYLDTGDDEGDFYLGASF